MGRQESTKFTPKVNKSVSKVKKAGNNAIVKKIMTPPKPKKTPEKKPAPTPGSACKTVKKGAWKRKPMPAHSGVPLPEKLKKYMEMHKANQDLDCSL